MIKEDHLKASKPFRNFILGLLEKDTKKRLGNNLNEFINHEFFQDFNWNNEEKLSQEFLDSLPSFDKNSTRKSINELSSLYPSQNQKFHYDIKGFTYENESMR